MASNLRGNRSRSTAPRSCACATAKSSSIGAVPTVRRGSATSTRRSAMTDPVLQTLPLGFQWATVDPFLFCVHHLDHYPDANEFMGPNAPLEARDIGMDFAG